MNQDLPSIVSTSWGKKQTNSVNMLLHYDWQAILSSQASTAPQSQGRMRRSLCHVVR